MLEQFLEQMKEVEAKYLEEESTDSVAARGSAPRRSSLISISAGAELILNAGHHHFHGR
jgi:hypothetical protein